MSSARMHCRKKAKLHVPRLTVVESTLGSSSMPYFSSARSRETSPTCRLIAIGANTDGRREVLGMQVGAS